MSSIMKERKKERKKEKRKKESMNTFETENRTSQLIIVCTSEHDRCLLGYQSRYPIYYFFDVVISRNPQF